MRRILTFAACLLFAGCEQEPDPGPYISEGVYKGTKTGQYYGPEGVWNPKTRQWETGTDGGGDRGL